MEKAAPAPAKAPAFDHNLPTTEPLPASLPLFHSCDTYTLRAIVHDNEIKAVDCPVFKRPLAYLFYGRPAYKPNEPDAHEQIWNFPVVLILKKEAAGHIDNIFPFDSGAFSHGLFSSHLHADMKITDFGMAHSWEAIQKVIRYFYGSNHNYFRGKALTETANKNNESFEQKAYHQIITDTGRSRVDDRRSTIEIINSSAIPTTTHLIEAVVVPEELTQNTTITRIIEDTWGAKLLTYETYNIPSSLYYTDLLRIAKQYMTDNGYFNE